MLKPNRNFVLLKNVKIEEKTSTGILVNLENSTPIYEVVELGPTVTAPIKVGDKVVLTKVSGQPISDSDGTLYTIVDDRGIIAVVED